MKISLPCLFLLCITVGSLCQGMKQFKTSPIDKLIKQVRRSTDHNVPTPHHIQSDQRVPKQNPSKANRKKCYEELLRKEKKLKRQLVNAAKKREQLNEKIEKEQRYLVQLQTKKKRPIKSTPKLRKFERWDRKQIKLQNELKEKIENVQKRFCSDFDATTNRTIPLETTTSTALPVKVESTEVKPTRKHPRRKPSHAEKVRGRKSKTVRPKPWLTSLPTSVGATTPHVSSTTVPSSESNKMKTPTTEAKLGPYMTPWKTAFDPTTTTVEVPKADIGIETTTDSKMKTTMPRKSVFSITPTTVHMKSIGHTSTTRKATLWSPSSTLEPPNITGYPHLSTESSSMSTIRTTTGSTTNTISTTKNPYRTITPSSHQASRSEPLDVTTYTLPSAPTLSSTSATEKTFKLDKATRNPVTEPPITQHRGKVNNERGRSLSSIVDAYNKSEKEALVLYVGVALSVVIVVILLISVAIYFVIFHGKCVKMKDEESMVNSKCTEE